MWNWNKEEKKTNKEFSYRDLGFILKWGFFFGFYKIYVVNQKVSFLLKIIDLIKENWKQRKPLKFNFYRNNFNFIKPKLDIIY